MFFFLTASAIASYSRPAGTHATLVHRCGAGHGVDLLIAVRDAPVTQLAPVDGVRVEERAVDAREQRLAADADAAGAAHAGPVEHDRIEGHQCLHTERLRDFTGKHHHK